MREQEPSLQEYGEFLLKARLVKEKAAPYCVRWVRRFLARPAANEPLADQVRRFCEELETDGGCQDRRIQVIFPRLVHDPHVPVATVRTIRRDLVHLAPF